MNLKSGRMFNLRLTIPVIVLLLAACAPPMPAPAPAQGRTEDTFCVDQQTGAQLSYADALAIARSSACLQEGQLKETHFCNPNSGTWWIDLDADKPGCAPACVIDVSDRSAEINWRCTGALPPRPDTVESDAPRVLDPDTSPADLSELSEGNSAFAFDLYQAVRGREGNLFFSPFSISMALAMTYAGARTQTAVQMADTLHFTLPDDRLHAAFNGLDLQLAQRGQDAPGGDNQSFRLHIVNALWGQQDYSFLQSFLDLLAQNYGAGMRLLDFMRAPEEARITINDWASEQTEGRIENLIPEGVIDDLTRLVLTNAIYFNAAWLHPFNERATADGTFHLLDGSEADVPMMTQSESFGYSDEDGFQAIELPYASRELSMVIILPAEGEFETVEERLDSSQLAAVVDVMEQRQVLLTMPRFEFSADFGLAETLASMGMPDAFGEAADFSGMTGGRELFIQDVVHKAFVSVDEAGTEAAAATAVVMGRLGMPAEPVELTIDRPFIFVIRDLPTGATLFVGRFVNPSAS